MRTKLCFLFSFDLKTVHRCSDNHFWNVAAKLIVEARAGSKDELIDHPLFKVQTSQWSMESQVWLVNSADF